MLALQAQMNPHFLYNTLSLIHVMAEDGCEEEILNVTECLSEMLRYISSGSTEPVIMRREIGFVENYLAIIHERYGDKLKCEINIPQSMQQIKMPKLIIQPLLENCTKYAMNGRPPWLLSVTGELTDDRWRVSVCDNGPGFSAEVLQELSEKMAAADLNNNTEVLEIDGMGLVNIYTRLKLFYGKEGYFEIKNSAGGGAEIIIGGTYEGEIEI